MATSKIPRKYDFTKNRWPGPAYETLDDEALQNKINEIDDDTRRLSSIPQNYKIFINDLKKIDREHSEFYNKHFIKTYENKIIRKTKVKKYTEFIFIERQYEEHDIYFKNKDDEKKFFSAANKLCDIFLKALNLFRRFHTLNGMAAFLYFYQKDSVSKNSIFLIAYPIWEGPFSRDIEKFTELRRQKWMSHHSFNPLPCTDRTKLLLSGVHGIGIEKKLWGNVEEGTVNLPNMPTFSYAEWYFKKIVDENNKERRKVELILRSRKRTKELATNYNFIYVLSNKSYPDIFKIGWTSGLPEERAEELTSTGVLYPFKVEFNKKFKDAEKVEQKIHDHFSKFRVRDNKEFFKVDLKRIKDYINNIK